MLGSCRAQELEMLRVATKLGLITEKGVVRFVLPIQDGRAHFGVAAARWAVDLYRYALFDAAPQQKHRIIGLLLGYSADAIGDYEEQDWTLPTLLSHERGSS